MKLDIVDGGWLRWGNERRRRRGGAEGSFPRLRDGFDKCLKRLVSDPDVECESDFLDCEPIVVPNITNTLDVAVVEAKPFQLGERFFLEFDVRVVEEGLVEYLILVEGGRVGREE